MSSGVGRGRGWLNLKTQTPGPEKKLSPPANTTSSSNFDSQDNSKFSDSVDDYTDLINKIKQLNVVDDGIKFNQKIRYIIESWTQDCQNSFEVEKSFDAIHEASLLDADVATKLVLLISSRTFLSQEIHDQNIRLMFLRKLQDSFEGGAQLQSSRPDGFRNSVQLLGDFFNRARLANGQPFLFMATPLLSCLEMLLSSAEAADLKLFTTQVYLNGNLLKQECPDKMGEIMSKVRQMLCSEKRYAKECKLWLLLALEVCGNRFALLPADIYKFYQEELGEKAMAAFQGSHETLTVQTVHNSKTLDGYQSNVSVLQVSKNDISLDQGSPSNNSAPQSSQSDNSQNIAPKKEHQSNSSKGGKSGRPILGVGARLQRDRFHTKNSGDDSQLAQNDSAASTNWNRNKNQNSSDSVNWHKSKNEKEGDSDANWRDKDNKKGTDKGNQKKEWDKKKTPSKNKKGWEHDDRFETDYN